MLLSSACRHGCYVSGLYLEGAAWDVATGQLTRQAPRQLVDELPLLQVSGVLGCSVQANVCFQIRCNRVDGVCRASQLVQ
jgi:hypothetical protein